MNDGTTASRLHYMDSMRSVLMLLGVVLHAARPYDSNDWQVKDAARLELLDGLVAGIHLFRMPAFFVVAGYFAMYLLVRRPLAFFLRERMRRVLVPLLATLLTFNLLQVWLVMGSGGEAGFLRGALLPAWEAGRWVSHLWFLVVLAGCFALVALFAPWLRRLGNQRSQASPWLAERWVLPAMLLAGVLAPVAVAVAAQVTGSLLTDLVLGSISIAEFLRYLPCFAIGMMLCAEPRLLDRFARCDAIGIALAICGFVAMQLTDGRPEPAWRAAHMLAEALLSWMLVRAVFALFRRWVDRPSRVFAYLSSATYSIYLFHHVAVIAMATVLLPVVTLAAGAKFLFVLAVASLVPLVLHHFLVRRVGLLGYLFNGRVVEPAPTQVASPGHVQPAAPAGSAKG